jgi:hypothetical protein
MNGDFKEIFGFVDIGIGTMYLVIFLILLAYKRSKVRDLEAKVYFNRMVLLKLFMTFVFVAMYIFYYKGGDNTAYWQGGVKLNKLFFDNPGAFFDDLTYLKQNTFDDLIKFQNVGNPPNYIFRGYESWFVCKVVSIVSFLTLRSYLATTLFFAYFAMMASWRLFELINRYEILSKRNAAIATLFIPSVGIWCTGITKDALIYITILYLITNVFSIFNGWNKLSIKSIIIVIVASFIIYQLRSFIFYLVVVSIGLGILAGYQRKIKQNFILRIAYFVAVVSGFVLLLFVLVNSNAVDALNESSFMEEAEIVQNDFIKNETYKGQRYDLGEIEFSVFGLLKVFPISVLTSFYRPIIFEARSPILIANALESLIFIWFTLKFIFQGSIINKIRTILTNEALSFALYFSVFLGFIVGFTSILFGVLVRFRAPLLPFLAIILLAGISYTAQKKSNEEVETQNNPSI